MLRALSSCAAKPRPSLIRAFVYYTAIAIMLFTGISVATAYTIGSQVDSVYGKSLERVQTARRHISEITAELDALDLSKAIRQPGLIQIIVSHRLPDQIELAIIGLREASQGKRFSLETLREEQARELVAALHAASPETGVAVEEAFAVTDLQLFDAIAATLNQCMLAGQTLATHVLDAEDPSEITAWRAEVMIALSRSNALFSYFLILVERG